MVKRKWVAPEKSSNKSFTKYLSNLTTLFFQIFIQKKARKKESNNWALIKETKNQWQEPQRFSKKHLIIPNAKRFCKVQEEISRLVFSRMRLEIEMTDDDDQTIWKWFPIPELTNEPSWLVQCKKLLVKEGGFWFTTSPDLESIKILRIVDCQSFLWQDLLSFFLLWSPWP